MYSSRKTKHVASLVVNYSSLLLGMAFVFLSPTLIDFSTKFKCTVEDVSKVFSVNTASYLCGCLSSGIAFKYVNRHMTLIFLFTWISIGWILVPLTSSLPQFFLINGAVNFALGGLDTAHITWMIEIWRSECPPFVLGQNLSFAIGTMLPALILAPFLTHHQNGDGALAEKIDISGGSSIFPPFQPTHLLLPFVIGSVLMWTGTLGLIFLFFFIRRNETEENCEEEAERERVALLAKSPQDISLENRKVERKLRMRTLLVIMSMLVMGFYVPVEIGSMQFIPTFSVYSNGISEAEAARVLLALTLAVAITRGIGIWMVTKLASEFILMSSFCLMFIANTILLTWAQASIVGLWAGSVLMGLGLSLVFPCYYAFIERYLHISDMVNSLILISGGCVQATWPFIVGRAIEHYPVILCYANFVSIGVSGVTFGLIYYLTVVRERRVTPQR